MKAADIQPGDVFEQPGPGSSTSYTVEAVERDYRNGYVVLTVRRFDSKTALRMFAPHEDVPLTRPVVEA